MARDRLCFGEMKALGKKLSHHCLHLLNRYGALNKRSHHPANLVFRLLLILFPPLLFNLLVLVLAAIFGRVIHEQLFCLSAGATVAGFAVSALGLPRRMEKGVDGVVDYLYQGADPPPSLEARLQGPLTRLRYLAEKGAYEPALALTREILAMAPNHPETLYIKARILEKGFDNPQGARVCLNRLIATAADPNDCFCRWAKALCEQERLSAKAPREPQ